MSTRTPLPGSTTARITPRATDVLSAWGTSAATGPIIVQRATWAMRSSATAEPADMRRGRARRRGPRARPGLPDSFALSRLARLEPPLPDHGFAFSREAQLHLSVPMTRTGMLGGLVAVVLVVTTTTPVRTREADPGAPPSLPPATLSGDARGRALESMAARAAAFRAQSRAGRQWLRLHRGWCRLPCGSGGRQRDDRPDRSRPQHERIPFRPRWRAAGSPGQPLDTLPGTASYYRGSDPSRLAVRRHDARPGPLRRRIRRHRRRLLRQPAAPAVRLRGLARCGSGPHRVPRRRGRARVGWRRRRTEDDGGRPHPRAGASLHLPGDRRRPARGAEPFRGGRQPRAICRRRVRPLQAARDRPRDCVRVLARRLRRGGHPRHVRRRQRQPGRLRFRPRRPDRARVSRPRLARSSRHATTSMPSSRSSIRRGRCCCSRR